MLVGFVTIFFHILGDFDYKRVPGFGPFEQLISPEPEISDWVRTPSDEFVVLACDGVWDVMSNKDICDFIRYQLTVTDKLEDICEAIVDNCLNKVTFRSLAAVTDKNLVWWDSSRCDACFSVFRDLEITSAWFSLSSPARQASQKKPVKRKKSWRKKLKAS